MTDLRNGLLVAYLVDEGDYFQYVQRQLLVGATLTAAALQQNALNKPGEVRKFSPAVRRLRSSSAAISKPA